MVKRVVAGGMKDENGIFMKPLPPATSPIAPKEDPVTDVSIDALLLKGLTIIDRTMRSVQIEVSTGTPSRESIMNLKDCMAMLHDLKEKEKELLENLTDEELETASSK